MELNAIANIKLIIESYERGGMPIDDLLSKIDGQANILMEYIKDSAKVIEKNNMILRELGVEPIRLPYWHETKEKLGVK